MAHNVQSVTLALTLPITCHICLGKVRQPVICANHHVFCSVCIELWLKNNNQCPACRVPITEENPCKNIIGGTSEDEGTLTPAGRKHLRKTRLELLQKEYEEEIESLLKETEELKRANADLEERIRESTDPADSSISCKCGNTEPEGGRSITDGLLEEWSKKLEMVNAANRKVVEDSEKLKEENQKLRNENIECARENLRLKNEVELRSPQKFGRFTVAALQAKVDQYEREMSRLKKALERSDQYIEELEAQVEQLKRPPEDIQKEKSQGGNTAHVHVSDATNARICQELNATQQFFCRNLKTEVCSEESNSTCSSSNGHSSSLSKLRSVCENEGSPEQRSTFRRYSSTLLNRNEQVSTEGRSQREGADISQGSPSSSLPFSSLHLHTPDNKASCSPSPSHLKKPLTYLRKLVFDDLPKRKDLCKSNSFNNEKSLNTVEGLARFRDPKPIFCQVDSEPGNLKELCTVQCNGKSQSSYGSTSSTSGSKINLQSDSAVIVHKGSEDATSSRRGEEPIASDTYAPCSSSADAYGEDSQYYMNQPAGGIQEKNSPGHLPPIDPLSLQSKQELIFHSASGPEECTTGHVSWSTQLSHSIPYSNSPPAKRKMLNQSSDSPSKSTKS
ncbi:hypothetical protein GDO81_005320 [Engystomops pustulosus]|uniref:RING-type domain-containing protein n=1 Tax=Engystomops pustulosus TaxID=76066 RepID=A0AAV7CN70_ENGPU|nr:hypothetical protein GDO81_005320 [Engystomops pustulosus]